VAEEMAHRGERTAAIRLRRRLLTEHGGGGDRRLAAPLLKEKIRLIGHELAQRRQRARAIVRIVRVQLRHEAWTPEVDELLAAARGRTRPDRRLLDSAA
jgi:hypothetical protein